MSTNADDHEPDLLAALAAVNPVPPGDTARPRDDAAAEALFQEIIMSDIKTIDGPAPEPDAAPTAGATTSSSGSRRLDSGRSRTGRGSAGRRGLMAAAAVVLGTAGFAATSLIGQDADNAAAAAMISAGEATSATESGRMVTEIRTSGAGEDVILVQTTTYHGPNSETLSNDLSPDVEGDFVNATSRIVDGAWYSTIDPTDPDSGWYIWDQDMVDALSTPSIGAVADRVAATDSLVELIRSASDATQLDDHRYRATVTVGDVLALDVPPASLELFTTSGLPDDQPLAIDMTVDDEGRLVQFELEATDLAPLDGVDDEDTLTVSTTFSDFDEIDPILAPEDAVPAPSSPGPGGTPAEEHALNILDDLAARRPDLCVEFNAGDEMDEYVTCLREAGEDEAADAFELFVGDISDDDAEG